MVLILLCLFVNKNPYLFPKPINTVGNVVLQFLSLISGIKRKKEASFILSVNQCGLIYVIFQFNHPGRKNIALCNDFDMSDSSNVGAWTDEAHILPCTIHPWQQQQDGSNMPTS